MRKLVIGGSILVALAVFVLLGMPFFLGIALQKAYPKMLAQLSKSPELRVKILSYSRGWFHSKAKLEISLLDKWLPKNASTHSDTTLATFIVNETIDHGPIIFATGKDNRVRIKIGRALLFNTADSNAMRFQSETLWTLGNKVSGFFAAPRIQLHNTTGRFVLNQLNGQFTYFPGKKHIKTQLVVQQGQVVIPPHVQLQLKKLNSQSNLKQHNSLWYGTRSATCQQLTLNVADKQSLQIQQIDVSSKQTQNDDNTNITVSYQTGAIQGLGLNLKHTKLHLHLRNLNSKALSALLKQAKKITPNQPQLPINTALLKPLMNLVSKGLTVQISPLDILTAYGPVHLTAQAMLAPQAGKFNPFTLLGNIRAQADLTVPMQWLTQRLIALYQNPKFANVLNQSNLTSVQLAHQQINFWIRSGQLKKSGNTLTIKVRYAHGQLLINNKPASAFPRFLPNATTSPKSNPEEGWEMDGEQQVMQSQ